MNKNIEFKKQMYLVSGQPLIEINEETEFQKPVSINGYEANNYKELRDMYESNVISLDKFDDIIALLEIGELGIVKQRKKYKELYEEENQRANRLASENMKLYKLINELDTIALDKNYKEIWQKIDEIRRWNELHRHDIAVKETKPRTATKIKGRKSKGKD